MSALAEATHHLPQIEPESLPEWAEWLFRFGCDTADIAEILDVPEADAQRALDEGRGAR